MNNFTKNAFCVMLYYCIRNVGGGVEVVNRLKTGEQPMQTSELRWEKALEGPLWDYFQ